MIANILPQRHAGMPGYYHLNNTKSFGRKNEICKTRNKIQTAVSNCFVLGVDDCAISHFAIRAIAGEEQRKACKQSGNFFKEE
jgi:hypothetical protein